MERVLILEHHAAFRQALACLLELHTGVRESLEAASLAEARMLLSQAPVDAAIVDLGLPGGDGARFLREVRDRLPGVGLLALCPPAQPPCAVSEHCRGADEILSKEGSISDILQATKRVAG